VTAVEAMAFDV